MHINTLKDTTKFGKIHEHVVVRAFYRLATWGYGHELVHSKEMIKQ